MHRSILYTVLGVSLALAAFAQNQPPQQSRDREVVHSDQAAFSETIPAGTEIPVRTDETINVKNHTNGKAYTASVSQDVVGTDGALLIPRGSQAELAVKNAGQNELVVDLDSVTVNGRPYVVDAEAYNRSRAAGLGKNKRTGKYVGGGAVLGTIVGAIAGGGKGAAIGAVAGGAAGAGAQVATRGKAIDIPAETVVRFKLNQPLELAGNNR